MLSLTNITNERTSNERDRPAILHSATNRANFHNDKDTEALTTPPSERTSSSKTTMTTNSRTCIPPSTKKADRHNRDKSDNDDDDMSVGSAASTTTGMISTLAFLNGKNNLNKVTRSLPTIMPPPRCVCNWKNCRTYQKAYRKINHPIFNGIIQIKFQQQTSNGNHTCVTDTASMLLKASIDRTLKVSKDKRHDWKITSSKKKGRRGGNRGENKKIVVYNIARHHFTEQHIRRFLNKEEETMDTKGYYNGNNHQYQWTSFFTEQEAKKYLFKLDPKEKTIMMNEKGGEEQYYYVQCPNVSKDHVRNEFLKIKRNKNRCHDDKDAAIVTTTQGASNSRYLMTANEDDRPEDPMTTTKKNDEEETPTHWEEEEEEKQQAEEGPRTGSSCCDDKSCKTGNIGLEPAVVEEEKELLPVAEQQQQHSITKHYETYKHNTTKMEPGDKNDINNNKDNNDEVYDSTTTCCCSRLGRCFYKFFCRFVKQGCRYSRCDEMVDCYHCSSLSDVTDATTADNNDDECSSTLYSLLEDNMI